MKVYPQVQMGEGVASQSTLFNKEPLTLMRSWIRSWALSLKGRGHEMRAPHSWREKKHRAARKKRAPDDFTRGAESHPARARREGV